MSETSMPGPILLASGSPRRRELLEQIGVAYQVLPADIDETAFPGEAPGAYTSRIAAAKVREVAPGRAAGQIVLGADTAVVLGDRMLGKPSDETEAVEMLHSLSGRSHEVYTAVAVLAPGGELHQRLNISRVTFAKLDDAWVRGYVASGEPMDKAGAYGIQGYAACQIREVVGSHSSIMGLPLFETALLLARAGLRLPPLG